MKTKELGELPLEEVTLEVQLGACKLTLRLAQSRLVDIETERLQQINLISMLQVQVTQQAELLPRQP